MHHCINTNWKWNIEEALTMNQLNLHAHKAEVDCLYRGMKSFFSDETFCTQSQIMVEKVPEFSAESLCLHQGMGSCAECFIRNYASRVQKHSLMNSLFMEG